LELIERAAVVTQLCSVSAISRAVCRWFFLYTACSLLLRDFVSTFVASRLSLGYITRQFRCRQHVVLTAAFFAKQKHVKKGSPYSITDRRVPELILVLGSQPAGDVSHKPGGRLPLLFARPAVTPAALKRAATNFAAW